MVDTYEQDPTAAPTAPTAPATGEAQQPPADPAELALVSQWQDRIKAALGHHEKSFKAMRKSMDLARLGADGEWKAAGNYVANIVQRHIRQSVATLYAKNPRAVAKRRERLEFAVWDGKPETAQMALATVQQAAAMPPPIDAATGMPAVDPMTGAPPVDPAVQQAQAVLQDIADAQQRMQMMDRLGKTLEILFHYFLKEQQPRFKALAKRAVRRSKVCRVAYAKLSFQRIMEKQPDITARIEDVQNQLATLQRLMQEAAEGDFDEQSAKMAELTAMLADLQDKETIVVREGPVWQFPAADSIVIDPKCKELVGFVGADWVAEKFEMSPEHIKEVYNADIGTQYTQYRTPKLSKFETDGREPEKSKSCCIVYEIHDKKHGFKMAIADGYPCFLLKPAAPETKIEQFFPYFPLVFNDIEHFDEIFGESDVELLAPMQREYNRSRQSLREHRRANRPKYIVGKGLLGDTDRDLLKVHPDSAILELGAIQPGQRAEDLIQVFKPAPIDPALYDTSVIFDDALRTVGTQQANLGPTDGATATESSIAESSRMTAESSDVDEVDDWLTEIARATSEVMLMELSSDTVMEIVGPGAVWPELSRQDIAKEVWLEILAGSSGRPNRAAELANLERATPLLVQTPGINPVWLARKTLTLMDDGIDLSEALAEGMPSIMALNGMAKTALQPPTGDPATDPNQQGAAGAQGPEAPPGGQPAENTPGPQPAFPAPAPVM